MQLCPLKLFSKCALESGLFLWPLIGAAASKVGFSSRNHSKLRVLAAGIFKDISHVLEAGLLPAFHIQEVGARATVHRKGD